MAISTPKEELVAFDDLLAGFDDMLVVAQAASKYEIPGGPQGQARISDKIWRPVPYIPAVFSGFDQTSNFGNITRLAVPVSIGQHYAVPVAIGPKDGRDQDSISRYFMDGAMTLASKVNQAVYATAAANATLVSKRTTAAGATGGGFPDLAAMSAIFTEQGIPQNMPRKAFYGARDYLGMVSGLATPQTSGLNQTMTAYERAYVASIGGFDIFENDQPLYLTAAAGTGVTITNTQPLFYTPVASTMDALGNTTNIDNRTQTISIAVTSGTVKVGDAFTIAGVNSVHHISKANTNQLKTFRVMSIVSGAGGTGQITISPPIISNGGGTRAEQEYQNVSATPTNGAAITFLNTVTANQNVFFAPQAVELIPGSFAVDPGDGWSVVAKGTTPKLGLPISYVRQANVNDLSVKARLDIDFGTGATNPEMIGLQLFSQT